jgi:cytochrome oxidase assembly protein ShyY1
MRSVAPECRHYRAGVLLRGRWLLGHLLAITAVAGFALLGWWQLDRHHEKREKIRAARAEYAAPAPELTAAPAPPPGDRVQASGTYEPAGEVLLRGRSRGDTVGADVLTLLRLDDGTAVVVDRGFVASGRAVAPPPAGRVTVRGIVRASRPLSPDDTVLEIDGHPSIPRVDVSRLGIGLPYRVRDVWIDAQYQEPPPGDGAPRLPDPPPPTTVNHLQYALQWFGLAAVPLVGWPIMLVRVARRRPPRA